MSSQLYFSRCRGFFFFVFSSPGLNYATYGFQFSWNCRDCKLQCVFCFLCSFALLGCNLARYIGADRRHYLELSAVLFTMPWFFFFVFSSHYAAYGFQFSWDCRVCKLECVFCSFALLTSVTSRDILPVTGGNTMIELAECATKAESGIFRGNVFGLT